MAYIISASTLAFCQRTVNKFLMNSITIVRPTAAGSYTDGDLEGDPVEREVACRIEQIQDARIADEQLGDFFKVFFAYGTDIDREDRLEYGAATLHITYVQPAQTSDGYTLVHATTLT